MEIVATGLNHIAAMVFIVGAFVTMLIFVLCGWDADDSRDS
jgi:hypothetical protein